ncbi:TPA: PspA/IM30 family protein [Candidatus Poribacteria bacterium]|nr:PspA/IM30 family protein [Candidatus Poribacteria bacterium]
MSIFSRIKAILRSGFNDLLEDEDPKLILDNVISRMKEELRELKLQVASAIRDQINIERQLKEQKRLVEKWKNRAREALLKGNEDLARRSLSEKIRCESLATELERQLDEQRRAVERLKAGLKRLEVNVRDAERRKTLLLARMKRAEASKAVARTLSDISGHDVADLMDQIEHEVLRAEAELELSGDSNGSSLERKFRQIEGKDEVERELERLKSDIGR